MEAICTISFKIRGKIEVTDICNASHFADEFVYVSCVGHMFFRCEEMHLSSAFYRQILACFTEIYL